MTIDSEIVENISPFLVDGEAGRYEFKTYSAVSDGDQLFSTVEMFPERANAGERYLTKGFKEIAFFFGVSEMSFRSASAMINRMRHQPDGTPARSLRDASVREGKLIQENIQEISERTLGENHFSLEGSPLGDSEWEALEFKNIEDEKLEEALVELDISKERWDMIDNNIPFESKEDSVWISIDDVLTKKAERTQKWREATNSRQCQEYHRSCGVGGWRLFFQLD